MTPNNKNFKLSDIVSKIGVHIFLLLFVGIIVFPVMWLIFGSFKTQVELYSPVLNILPESFNLNNYIAVFKNQPFHQYIINSFAVAILTTCICLVAGSMAAYSIARVNIRGKRAVLLLLLSITLLPPVTLLNPIYRILGTVGLLNSYSGLAIAITAIELPMAVWFLTGFFQTLPQEIEESAMIDGASIPRLFLNIIIPLVAPGMFTISILVFINTWNNYLFAQVFNPMPAKRTVTVALTMFQTDLVVPWEIISAAAISVTAPLILVVLILQKKIISGLMEGSVKG